MSAQKTAVRIVEQLLGGLVGSTSHISSAQGIECGTVPEGYIALSGEQSVHCEQLGRIQGGKRSLGTLLEAEAQGHADP